jgi:riboflavin synthase
MFTGIIQETGHVVQAITKNDGMSLTIHSKKCLGELEIGASISVNGICLTVEVIEKNSFSCHLVPETLTRSCLQYLHAEETVNLELPLRLQDRLGGHLVQGHVDGTGVLIQKEAQKDGSSIYKFKIPSQVAHFMIEKGSITIDGISLTIAAIEGNTLSIALIPHTLSVTNLNKKEIGDLVNIEIDMMAKYAQKLLMHIDNSPQQFASLH